MQGVAPLAGTVLEQLQAIGVVLLVLARAVVPLLGLGARELDDGARLDPGHRRYSTMLTGAPAPTVRPPSRMANRWPVSSAIGVMSSTDISTLSPGMTISAPSGSPMAPVTSVVRR